MANWLLLAMLLRISDAARRPASLNVGGTIAPPPPPIKLHEAQTEVVARDEPAKPAQARIEPTRNEVES